MAKAAPAFWQSRSAFASLALSPLAWLFGCLAGLRRFFYRHRWLDVVSMPVPVIVVGNIAVGGSGKTPVVAWLVSALRKRGYSPGIVSRGYGGTRRDAHLLNRGDLPAVVGDEPLLLKQQCDCPVAIGRDRVAAARCLLGAHPECDLIISDDGMQHYRLERTVEIAVVDESVLGNGRLLPAGPLREPRSRLASVDLVIGHGGLGAETLSALRGRPVVGMRLEGGSLQPLSGQKSPDRCVPLADFRGRRVHAVAGIGRPQRFFDDLSAAGLTVIPHPFPDHHRFQASDLSFGDRLPIVLTSKDAVKCADFAPPDTWELPVQASIDEAALDPILEKLTHGRSFA